MKKIIFFFCLLASLTVMAAKHADSSPPGKDGCFITVPLSHYDGLQAVTISVDQPETPGCIPCTDYANTNFRGDIKNLSSGEAAFVDKTLDIQFMASTYKHQAIFVKYMANSY